MTKAALRRRGRLARTGRALVLVVLAYAAAAYLAALEAWRLLLRAPDRPAEMVTRTPAGIAGDPVNLGLVGHRARVMTAFAAAGWHPADALTLKSAIEIGVEVILDRPYADAPVSTLLFEGRPQDLAFERQIGPSPDRRHHLRLWLVSPDEPDDPPLWLGAASLDRGVGFSHDTGQFTHHIDPDLDAERELVVADLAAAGMVAGRRSVPGLGPTPSGRNGGGDPYFTDGMATIVTLAP